MTQGKLIYDKADFYAEIAAILRIPTEELAEFESPQEAGVDSVRLLTLSEKWRKRGIDVSFMELAERPDFTAWWELLSARTPVTECEHP